MKFLRKTISLSLVLAMLCSTLPVGVNAEEIIEETMTAVTVTAEDGEQDTPVTSGTCGENLTWEFDEETGVLTISGTGEMEDYGFSTTPWDAYSNNIYEVVINNGVTSIGSGAFEGFSYLTDVSIPDSVYSIGHSAFALCVNLSHIVMPNSITELGSAVFNECSDLEYVSLSTALLAINDSVFSDCKSLSSINIPEGITIIGNSTFSGCTSLSDVTFPSSIEELFPYAFWKCTNLKTVTFVGNAPSIWEGDEYQYGSFSECELTAYYPGNNSTWTSDVMQDYGGDITWKPYCPDEHTWDEGEVTKEPTEEEAGIRTYTCEVCGETKTEEIEKLPHQHLYRATVTDPTCTEKGFTTYTCACGDTNTTTYVEPLGHDYTEEVTPPTCTEGGYTTFTCNRCEYTYVGNNTEPAGHQYEAVVTAPTCTEDGYTTYTCVCGIFYTDDETEAIGHDYATRVVAPTCTEEGYTTYICIRCNDTHDADPVPATGHSYSAFVTAPTCTEQGYTTYICACGDTTVTSYVDPLGHTEVVDEGRESTCTEDGLTEGKHCSVCEVVLVEQKEIPALGHSLGDWVTDGNQQHRVCEECGYAENKIATDGGNVEIEVPEQANLKFDVDSVKQEDNRYILVEKSLSKAGKNDCTILKVFDITLENSGGVPVQPNGAVKVKLPLDWDKEGNYSVYRVNNDETLTDMEATRHGSHMVFETDHFSLYVIVEEVLPPVNTVSRIFGSGRVETALEVAKALKETLGGEKFNAIIIANGENNSFADALTGSYLANKKGAPILLYRNSGMSAENIEFIANNLRNNGTVYLLGGTGVIPASVETSLSDYNVKRLAGTTRFDTNLAILKEAGVANEEILVARGFDFADSLSASATGLPILVVNEVTSELTEAQITFLKQLNGNKMTIIGGPAIITEELEAQIEEIVSEDVGRLYGATREDTSVLIADKYIADPDFAVVAYSRTSPDGLCGGPLAYAKGAPLLLTNAGQEGKTAPYVAEKKITAGYVLGGESIISTKTAHLIFGLSKNDTIQ